MLNGFENEIKRKSKTLTKTQSDNREFIVVEMYELSNS